ncbi:MAG: mechanosensitive ion channel family protein [Psychroflexus sp.]|nr:mechanosensitive ion channel family protein [Psychroflexus sp.]
MNKTTSDRFVYNFLVDNFHLSEVMAKYLNVIISFILLLIFGFLLFKTLRYIAKKTLHQIAERSKTQFDDFLIKNKTFLNISNLITLNVISVLLPLIFIDFPQYLGGTIALFNVLITILIVMVIQSVLLTIKDFLATLEAFKDKPIQSYIQVFMIIIWLISFTVIFSIITGRPLLEFLTALGAFSAVLLLVFKDTILGFVASIQVAVNDTVRIGDWITMEKYGADGDVFEINLASVKIRNFDKTITTIPTYYLISDSFKNWRGMSSSGGRRIKRSIIIKSSSIQLLSEDAIEDLKKIHLISDYVTDKQNDINSFNAKNKIDKSVLLNGRNMTNFGIFRVYVDHYLHENPNINKEMIVMTRQLAPTSEGIPLEIYAFSQDKVWANYERIIADIFDHLLASTSYFDLEVFEKPSGTDLTQLLNQSASHEVKK